MKQVKKFLLPILVLAACISFQVLLNTLWSEDNQLFNTLRKVNSLLMIFAVTWLIIRIIRMLKYLLFKRYDFDKRDNLKSRKLLTQYTVIERILVFIIVLFAL